MNLEEVARLAGVSRSTVSRVVNGDKRVSDESRARVQEIIQAYNYHPNAAARSLASARTRILGLMIPRSVAAIFSDPFFPRVIQGVADACNSADQMLLLLMDTSDDGQSAERIYRRVIQGRHLDGLIIASSELDDPILELLAEGHFPVVLIGRHPHRDINFVDVDNRSAAKEAVRHLIGHGYRRIGLIGGPPNLIAAIDRHAGYVDALSEAEIEVDPSIVVEGDFTEASGFSAMKRLLVLPGRRVDAVFAASDTMALAAIRAIHSSGLTVPGDIAVFGFDAIDRGLLVSPGLSTVNQPVTGLGREAVSTLLRLIDSNESAPVHSYLPTHLVLRQSCGCMRP